MIKQKPVYVCGPLTELTDEVKETTKKFYEQIADVCEKSLGIRAFVPHEHYDPEKHANYTPQDVDINERKQVCELSSALVVYTIAPSWGGGIEVEMANNNNIPVILLCEKQKLKNRLISRLLRGNPAIKSIISFNNHEQALEQLALELKKYLSLIILPMPSWPLYFKDKLIIGNADSQIGIICLWTPVEKITADLDKSKFALAGQLYSKEGINYIIRNILANPKIRILIICGEERVGSGDALMKLIDKGVDDNNKILDTDMAQIHKEIPKNTIDLFRENVKYVNLTGETDTQKIITEINNYQSQKENWTKSKTFPEAEVEFDGVMPTDQSFFKIRRKYAGQVWLEILKKIMKFGTIRESFHGNNCKELFNITAVITDEDPENFKTFPYFQITEQDIKEYVPKFMTGEKGTADYTYGERLWNFPKVEGQDYKYNQVDDVIVDFLSRYPTDRAAYATTFGIQDHTAKSSPCMTFLQATNVDEKLELTAYFRSHDIFGGWLLNSFGLRTLQKYIADKLKMPLGNLNIISNCAHIYDNNWQIAQDLIEKHGQELDCTSDPRGYLVITLDNDEIVAKHVSPNGKTLQEFRQNGKEEKAAMKFFNKLVLADVVSLIPHAFDIGAELQKAEIAIKQGLNYTQDQELQF